ncbi:MAG: bacillolysin, partial [Saprospiraceae bacterium]
CDADDICPGGDDNIDTDNDGTPDFCDNDGCPDADSDGICDDVDECPNDPIDACNIIAPCTSAGSNTTYEYIQQVTFNTIDNSSGNNGGYADYTNLYTEVNNGMTYDITLVPGFASSAYNEAWRVWIDFNKDGDFDDAGENVVAASGSSTITSQISIPLDASNNGATTMRISMQYNEGATPCQNFTYGEVEDYLIVISQDCDEGQACDDSDPCTANDAFDVDCNCVGTAVADDDNDGVCNTLDECPGLDDALIGQSCDDGDACTINDVYDQNCGCSGVYTDEDSDGVCIGDDPDDNNPCVPNDVDCNPCNEITSDGYEAGYGNWNDGGGDCARVTQYPNTGAISVRLRDNSGVGSSMTSDILALSSYDEVTIDFSYYPNSMENGEDFWLQISTDGGSSYSTVSTWARGTDFNNGTRYYESVTIDNIALNNNTTLRLRCDASGNGDQIYIDDVIVSACSSNNQIIGIENIALQNLEEVLPDLKKPYNSIARNNLENDSEIDVEFGIYPNPARNFVSFKVTDGKTTNELFDIKLIDVNGKTVRHIKSITTMDNFKLDILDISKGIYLIIIETSGEIIDTHKVLVIK